MNFFLQIVLFSTINPLKVDALGQEEVKEVLCGLHELETGIRGGFC